MKRRFLRGAAYSTGSMLYSTLGLLVAGKLMTNALALEAVGEVALFLLVGEFLGTCCNLGLTAALPKLLAARDDPEADQLLGALLTFQFAVVLVATSATGLAAILAPWWQPVAARALPLSPALLTPLPALVAIIALRDFLLAAAAGRHAYGLRAGAIILMSTLQAVTFGALFLTGSRQPAHFALAYLAAAALGTGLLLVTARRPRWDGALVWAQLRFSLPLFVNTLLGFAAQRLDTLVVAWFLGVGPVAVFEMAKRIPGVVSRFLGAVLVPYLPSVATLLRDSGPAAAAGLVQRASVYTAFGGYLATLMVVAVQEPLLAALFTADYRQAAPAVGPLLIAACLSAQAGIMGQALIALNRPALVMTINIGLALIGVGLGIVLVPRFALAGAGWSAAAAAWFSLALQRAAVGRLGLSPGRPRSEWAGFFFLPIYGLVWYFNNWLWTLAMAVAYAGACVADRAITREDLRVLWRGESTYDSGR